MKIEVRKLMNTTKLKYISCSILALVIIGTTFVSSCAAEHEPKFTRPTATPVSIEKNTATISKVIDGDTVELETWKRVRLLDINAPEMGQPYHEEATNRLKELIENKTVILENDVEDKDRYGRFLRYVFLDNKNINVKMVEEGYANVYLIPPNTKYETELRKAENKAKTANRGIWQTSENLFGCTSILYFHWNAEGNDHNNLNDEYVVFRNTCSQSIDMTGWTVKDEANHIYTSPSFVLGSNAEVTLYSGCGTNTRTELYWCNSGAIWNNNGDTLFLRNANGGLVSSYSYQGFG